MARKSDAFSFAAVVLLLLLLSPERFARAADEENDRDTQQVSSENLVDLEETLGSLSGKLSGIPDPPRMSGKIQLPGFDAESAAKSRRRKENKEI